MEWLAFAGSIIGGLIGGLFTFLGVRYTIKNENKKARKEELKEAEANKPRLEITKFKDFKSNELNKSIDSDCNILALRIENVNIVNNKVQIKYDERALLAEQLCFVEYELRNTGLTEIEEVCVTSNLPKTMVVIPLERRQIYIDEMLLNYDVWANRRYIKSNKSIKLRIYYLKDKILDSPISYPFTIWLHDINGRYWEQKIDGKTKLIEISYLSSRESLIDNTNIDIAEECFKNPTLW